MLKKLQLLRSASTIGMTIGTVATLVVTAQANPSRSTSVNTMSARQSLSNHTNHTVKPSTKSSVAAEPPIETVSGTAEIELVEHLAANNVKFYGAYWCSHCQKQKSLFGAMAAAKLPYIECAADGEKSQRQLCKDKNIQMFPTWVIGGKYFTGTKDLKEIAAMTGYKGSIDFKYRK
jgi:glutaredoxin